MRSTLQAAFSEGLDSFLDQIRPASVPKRIVVFGAGYVGLIQAVGLQLTGHHVTVIEIDEKRLESVRQGIMPFYEPRMDEALKRALKAGMRVERSFEQADCIFICVNTPTSPDGRQDTRALMSVVDSLPQDIDCPVVTKSTVLPGTAKRISARLEERTISVPVVSNPEFLQEGSALFDFLAPDRVVIGSDDELDEDLFNAIYSFADTIFYLNAAEAELSKYAANLMLVTKISYANEIGNICRHLGADSYKVMDVVGSDRRIERSFLDSGIGYGGSCFPKDLRALEYLAQRQGIATHVLTAARTVNELQPSHAVRLAEDLIGDLVNRKIAVLGLSFKPGTGDTRQTPSEPILHDLLEQGAKVRVHDPMVEELTIGRRSFVSEPLDAIVSWADLVILAVAWPQYDGYDFADTPVVLGRRIDVKGTSVHGITW
jgi:UDPglucose 6-dehydrogenase